MSHHRNDISDFESQMSVQQRSTLETRNAKFIGTAPAKGHSQAFDDLYSPASPVKKGQRLGQQE